MRQKPISTRSPWTPKCGITEATHKPEVGKWHACGTPRPSRLRSGPEIKIPLRLQLRDPDHATLIGADKTRQQVFQRNVLRFHGVAACSELKAGPGKLAEAPGRIGIGRCRVKCPQRLAMHHKCDRDVVGTADTVEMVLNVTKNEGDFVEVAQVIDDLQLGLRRGVRGGGGA